MAKNWVSQLADRWCVGPSTVRSWAMQGHFGPIYRHGIGYVGVGSQGVLEFESKYADALGVGAPSLEIWQLFRRYKIARRTFSEWRLKYGFPQPVRIPGTIIRRWRVRDVEQWEFNWRITPKTTLAL